MKRLLAVAGVSVLVIAVVLLLLRDHLGGPIVGRHGSRLVFVGLDGASWNVLDPMLDSGDLPNLRELTQRGVTASLTSVTPLFSPPVWTSIATSVEPKQHGITHFLQTRNDVRAQTVWELLSEAGLAVGLYDYLVTWPPSEPPGGFCIPGWMRRDDRVAPADVFRRAGLEPYAYSIDGVYEPDELLEVFRRETTTKASTWSRLAETFSLDVGAVVFYSLDGVSHRFWHTSFPEQVPGLPAEDPPRDLVRATLRQLDTAVGQIVADLGPRDVVLLASDHGFQAAASPRRHWLFRVREVLEGNGLAPDALGLETVTNWKAVSVRVDADRDDRAGTMERVLELLRSARTVAGEPLLAVYGFTNPLSGEHLKLPLPDGILSVINDRMKQDPDAYGFVWAMPINSSLATAYAEGRIQLGSRVVPADELVVACDFTGEHAPVGVFIAAGGAVQHRHERLTMSVLDIAPLALYLADQAIPESFVGTLPTQLLSRWQLLVRPPRSRPALERKQAPQGEEVPGEAELYERLRSLGYVE